MLPKMNLKSQYFISRMAIFNETFCDLNGKQDICILWNEAITGRSAADITSAYFKIVNNLSDYKKFTIRYDNCCAQNKNWTLITGIWLFVNLSGGPDTIELKYLEKGHTFMRPAAVHGAIGNKMKKTSTVYDWNDLDQLIKNSSKKILTISLTPQDIHQFTDLHKKSTSLLNLASLKAIKVKRGSTKLHFKKKHSETSFGEVEFLHPNVLKNSVEEIFPITLQRPRGNSQN